MTPPEITASIARALWGEVFARLRSIQFVLSDGMLSTRFIVSDNPDDSDLESINNIGGEIAADFPDFELSEEVVVAPGGHEIPRRDDWHTAFQRKQPSPADGRSFAE